MCTQVSLNLSMITRFKYSKNIRKLHISAGVFSAVQQFWAMIHYNLQVHTT